MIQIPAGLRYERKDDGRKGGYGTIKGGKRVGRKETRKGYMHGFLTVKSCNPNNSI